MMKHAIVILFLLLNSLFLAPSSHASFDYAMKLYQEGKYDEAKYVFESLALVGDSLSLFNLGVLYHQGLGVEKNAAYAHALMRVANDDFSTEGFVNKIAQVESQLTDTEKEDAERLYIELKGTYSSSAVVETTFPKPKADKDCPPELEMLNNEKLPEYPQRYLQVSKDGRVKMKFTISPEGYVREIRILDATEREFGDSALKWMQNMKFESPADGSAKHSVPYTVTFSLAGRATQKSMNNTKKELDLILSDSNADDSLAQYKYALSLEALRSFEYDLADFNVEYQDINNWYLKSATAGFSPAQYKIGFNMIRGKGCEQDLQGGVKWITASAMGGHIEAQVDLGVILLKRGSSTYEYLGGIEWLRRAVQSGDHYAKVQLAWEQATSVNETFRDAEQALALISSGLKTYHDDVRILETKAAAYAEEGDFVKAIRLQKRAKKRAKRKGWKIAKLDERLALYTSGQAYRGSYY